MYYKKLRKKEMIKNTVIITLILLLAVISTYYIYHKFENEHNVDYNSQSLDIVFHEKNAEKVSLTKVTPVTDSIGLSSNAYTLTIKNNLTEPVKYLVKLEDDLEEISNDNCGEYQIPKEAIRVSIKEDKENKIYNLSDLEEGILMTKKINALGEKDISIRVWINKDSSIPTGSNLHYHSKIKVIEITDNVPEE